jgi:hypothetical protein
MKLLIADTQGSALSPAYRALLPNLTLRGIDHPDLRPHSPHGAWCGWLAGAPLQARGIAAEIVFLQILGPSGTGKDWVDFLLSHIAAEKPDVVSCSWGAWDQDDDFGEIFMRAAYNRYVEQLLSLKKDLGFRIVCAAGNDDFNDEDLDVAYPQKLMPDNAWIIGATDANGIPTLWSADGYVDAVMIGSKCASPDASGRWHLWQGTSAACPKFAGLIAAMGWNDEEILSILQSGAQHPAEWADQRPHTKWGWGSMEFGWQDIVRDLPRELRPPLALTAFDLSYEHLPDGRFAL